MPARAKKTRADRERNPIDRDISYLTWVLGVAFALFLVGIVLVMALGPMPYIGGAASGTGMALFYAGLIVLVTGIEVLMLLLTWDTWRVETSAELREKYGRSIKWGIFFVFLLQSALFLWIILLIGYFLGAPRRDGPAAAARQRRRTVVRVARRRRRAPAFYRRPGE